MATELPVLPFLGREAYVDRKPGRHTNKPRGWYPGYPEGVPASAMAVVEFVRPLDGRVFKVRVDKRLAEHYGLFLAMIQEVGYPLIGKDEPNVNGKFQGGIGSYANRPIKTRDGRVVPSEHSRAKALDLWTRSNPQRFSDRPHRMRSTWHPLAVRIAVAGDLEWGGHFHDLSNGTYSDPMHVQYRLWPADVAASTQRMIAEYEAIMDVLHPAPPPEEPVVKPEQVKLLQNTLISLGANPGPVDGVFGPKTEAALTSLPNVVANQVDLAEDAAFAAALERVAAAISQIVPQVD